MRIAFVLTKCTPDNSHGRYVIELCKQVAGRHTVEIYAGKIWPSLRSQVKCHTLPIAQRPLVAKVATAWTDSLWRFRRLRGWVIHVQGADAPIGNVVTAHCCNRVMKRVAGSEMTWYRRLNSAIGSVAEQYCMSRSARPQIIAVSHQLKEELVREYGADSSKVSVIHHGVDARLFHPARSHPVRDSMRRRLGFRGSEFVVMFVGADYRLKGLLPLLDAASRISNATVKVLAVGVSPDSGLKDFVEERGCAHMVSFLGNQSDLAPLYAASDCFVLPTRYDTFSLVVLEAMASGLPVIVSRNAGVTELLTANVDSFVIDGPLEGARIAEILQRLVNDRFLRKEVGARARETAERNSWAQVAERTLDVYRNVADAS